MTGTLTAQLVAGCRGLTAVVAIVACCLAVPAGGVFSGALVRPRGRVVCACLGVVAGKDSVQVVHVLEIVTDQRGRVGVGDDVLAEEPLVGQDVVCLLYTSPSPRDRQ